MKKIVGPALALAALFLSSPGHAADPVADFYKGKTVFIQIGSGPAGAYDITGRLFARHMGKYIPGNPLMVPQNVPGGGSLPLANQFGNTTARDGTVIGIFNNGMPTTPLLDPPSAHFDPRKFHFLGSPGREAHILVSWHKSPAQTMDDLFTKQVIVGATAPGAAPYDFPRLTNALIGTKFKIITGYQGTDDTKLAMERGEIDANAGLAWSSAKTDYADQIKSKEILVVAAFGMEKSSALPDVPLLPLGKTTEDRQLFQLMYGRQSYGRPFVTPPDVPMERVKALQKAFEQTMKDPDFLADAVKLNIDIDPVPAEELTKLTEKLFETPQQVLDLMHKTLTEGATK